MTLNRVESHQEADFIVTVHHDPDVEDPTTYGVLRFLSQDDAPPEARLCDVCGDYWGNGFHEAPEEWAAIQSWHEFKWWSELVGIVTIDDNARVTWYQEEQAKDRVLLDARLDHMRFVVVADEHEAFWAADTDRRSEIIKDTLDEFQMWAEGDTYWFAVEKAMHDPCPTCKRKFDDEPIEAIGGFIGEKWLMQGIEEIVGDSPVLIKEEY